ncbi:MULTISPECIES: maleylpyruvate isomerase family mycothiol-dependent enzyme [Arthrobacter]|uniref:Maleylpyruvate isomerase family mycothiol-dependent enzyme n=2 Tax=Arthrobacter TaxID=1663 RepID=A0ABU9KM25_9MICC|nr:maleylpyruvate isomerase family mycothiol-dependent enzyme [Arthrobacter sp. YJM1]MDP5227897.1 maleylpyruvate isomerase family mycothiol-dependent enzyme [Arthrobacter sp. YJM1]
MTQITPGPEVLRADLHAAAALVEKIAAPLDDAAVKAPSVLPGWSRGHVLAHIMGISDAMARQVESARRGELVELYDGGYEGRTARIELAAGHAAEEHRADVHAALTRALDAFDALGPQEWDARITYRDGVVRDGGLALWRELVIHGTDLGLDYGPETWSKAFCLHLFDFLEARVPVDHHFVLQPLGLPPRTLGAGPRGVVISGMLTDIAAWLAGREPSLDTLRASAAADDVDLPPLLPWPSGVAPTN